MRLLLPYVNLIVLLLLYFTGAGASNDNSGVNNKSKPWRSTYTDELPLNDVNASASIDGKCCFDCVLALVSCDLYEYFIQACLFPHSSLQSLIKCSVFILSVCTFGPET